MAERVREAPAEAPPAATRARHRAERARGAMPAPSSSLSQPPPLAPFFPPGEPKSVCVFPAPVWPFGYFYVILEPGGKERGVGGERLSLEKENEEEAEKKESCRRRSEQKKNTELESFSPYATIDADFPKSTPSTTSETVS